MKIGMDIYKRVCNSNEEDGSIREQYEMKNSYEEWKEFRDKYMQLKPDAEVI